MVALRYLASSPLFPHLSSSEYARRKRRWHSFQVVFLFAYLGIILDLVTTAMGFGKAGDAYEQNPLGAFLIGNFGWIGLFLLLTALSAMCYLCCRAVLWRMRPVWGIILNSVLAVSTLVRWIAVVTAVLYIVQPGQ